MNFKKHIPRKDIDKYFSGYQSTTHISPDGKQKRTMVYTGQLYRFNLPAAELRRVRLLSCLLSIGSVVLFLILSFLPISGCASPFISVPSLIAMIPMIYLASGLWNLCTTKSPFEERIPLLSYQRMRHSTIGILCFLALTMVMDLIYLIRIHPTAEKLPLDIGYLIGVVVCIAAMLLQWNLLRPLDVVSLAAEQENTDTPDTINV